MQRSSSGVLSVMMRFCEMIVLPAPEKGFTLNEVLSVIKSKTQIPELELPFKPNKAGIEGYINGNSHRGLLKIKSNQEWKTDADSHRH